jgi:latrophilin and seven transmembrane domain-containing 1
MRACVNESRTVIYYSGVFTCSQRRQGSILFTGEWSKKGCETTFNSTSTVCRCNHLTHFAILLSAQPLSDLSQPQTLALQITGYIGVSVSLVAMAATIFVFVFLK